MTLASKEGLQGLQLSSSIPGKVRRRRVLTFLAVATIGVALSWTGFALVRNEVRRANSVKFEQEASRIAADMETVFNSSLEHLHSISSFFAASDGVTREEFHTFVTSAHQRIDSLYVSAYLPRVEAEERINFEAKVRAEGFENFKIRAVNADGTPTVLPDRKDYFPIYYVESEFLDLLEVLGTDAGSHPVQAPYYRRAAETDSPVVTPPLSLIEDPEDQLSVMACMSVRFSETAAAEKCDGVAVVIHRIRPLVESVIGSKRLNELKVVITDPDEDAAVQLVHKNFPGSAEGIQREGWPLAEREVGFANQRWLLTLCPAGGSSFAPPAPPWWILGTGGVLSILLAYTSCVIITIAGLRKQFNRALKLGQYRLGQKLGEGGMGSVYEATHQLLARPAAIKLIASEDGVVEKNWQARFEREAQATAALQSAHTVSVYDFGKSDDGSFYYVMERLHGTDLATLVETSGPLSPARTVHLLRQVCHSLAEAHHSGLIHRDIKPANIFVCRQGLEFDFAKVLDFGLVKADHQTQSVEITQAGALLGTPNYMAPEMIDGQEVDGRADLYSLGCVAYWMLTGKTVFEGSLSTVIAGHVSQEPPSLCPGKDSAVPEQLNRIVLSCLEKNAADRPQTAAELASELASCSIQSWTQEEAIRCWMKNDRGEFSSDSSSRHEPTVSFRGDG